MRKKSLDKSLINYSVPELICTKEPNKKCNDGLYVVRIPINFLPSGQKCMGAVMEYRFIGLKYS